MDATQRTLTLIDVETRQTETRRVPNGATLFDVLRDAGRAVDFDCAGRGVCGRCRVSVVDSSGVAETKLACRTLVDRDGLRVVVPSTSNGARGAETLATRTRDVARTSTPEERAGSFGLAIDLGTTTLVGALVSLESGRTLAVETRRNPQIAFGRDVVSRIGYAARSADAAARLQAVVVRELGRIASELARNVGVSTEKIAEIVVAGNTTMAFLFVGRDATPLGQAPFVVGQKTFPEFAATAFDWSTSFADGANVRVFPVFSAFVGGDVLAGFERLRASDPRTSFGDPAKNALFLDVGTNGEAILAARGRYFSTSTAAGPAFEGSEISQGSLAVSGAIRAVEFAEDGSVWRPRTVGGVPATSVCGSGLIDATAGALATGVLAPNGRLRTAAPEIAALPPEFRARLGERRGERSLRIDDGDAESPGVRLTQRDVRQIQLAIGAIRAGLRLLLDAANVSLAELDAIYLAGGFGAALDRTNARRVGLLPPSIADSRIVDCGNASLFGAIDVLTKRLSWAKVTQESAAVANVELAADPRFPEIFAAATRFPTVDEFRRADFL